MCQTIRIYLKVLQSFRKTILMKTIMRTFYHMLICWKANILIFCYLAPFWYHHKLTVRHLLKAISKCIIPCVKLPKYTYIFRYHCIFYLVGTGKHIFEYSKHDFTSALRIGAVGSFTASIQYSWPCITVRYCKLASTLGRGCLLAAYKSFNITIGII